MCDKYASQRYLMWCDLIPGYADMEKQDKRKASLAFAQKCGKQNLGEIHTYKELHNLYQPNILSIPNMIESKEMLEANNLFANYYEAQPNKKENNMCYGQTTQANVTIQSTEKKDTSLQYIKDRAREIFYNKESEIEAMFEDPRPKTKKEAEKWLKDGNFRVDVQAYNDEYSHCHFAWGKDAPDYEKLNKLRCLLSKDLTDLKDTVSILSDEQARLQALKDFESKVYN